MIWVASDRKSSTGGAPGSAIASAPRPEGWRRVVEAKRTDSERVAGSSVGRRRDAAKYRRLGCDSARFEETRDGAILGDGFEEY